MVDAHCIRVIFVPVQKWKAFLTFGIIKLIPFIWTLRKDGFLCEELVIDKTFCSHHSYLNPNYNLMLQMDAIDDVLVHVETFLQKNIGQRCLIVVGTYVIGLCFVHIP